MQLQEYKKKQIKTMPADQADALVKKMKKESERLVKGMFEFVDAQGGWLDFSYRFFKDDPLITMRLVHGEICEIPMGIVRHLNNVYKKVRTLSNNLDEQPKNQRGLPGQAQKVSRVRFTPTEFI